METPIRHVRMPDEQWNALERIGEELDRTPAWLIRAAVDEYIDRHRSAKRAAKIAAQATREESVVDLPQA